MATPTREKVLAELQALASGVQKNMMSVTITLSGEDYGGAAIISRLQVVVDAARRVQAARAALQDALAAEESAHEGVHDFVVGVRTFIMQRFRGDLVALSTFGLRPKKKRRPMTAEESLIRTAKNRATRAKRGTMGKKQKAAIKGDVTGVTITPVTKGDGGEG